METIATANEIAADFMLDARVLKGDSGRATVEIVDLYLTGFEQDLATGLKPRGDQVLYDFVLGIYSDRASTGEFMHVDAMAAAIEAKLDTAMDQTLARHAGANAGFVEQIDCALLENARTDPLLRMLAGLGLNDDGLDAFEME
jgi:hypothetical protein